MGRVGHETRWSLFSSNVDHVVGDGTTCWGGVGLGVGSAESLIAVRTAAVGALIAVHTAAEGALRVPFWLSASRMEVLGEAAGDLAAVVFWALPWLHAPDNQWSARGVGRGLQPEATCGRFADVVPFRLPVGHGTCPPGHLV